MKKFISLILTLIFIISPICNSCFAVTSDKASLNQLLNTEVFIEEQLKSSLSEGELVYYQKLKEVIMEELHKRNLSDLKLKVQDNLSEINKLKHNLELLKLDNGTLYSSVENANAKIETSEKIQKILEDEINRRIPWSMYILKKAVNAATSFLKGGIVGSISGSIVSAILSPLMGFNPKLILKWSLNQSISYSISSIIGDSSKELDEITDNTNSTNFTKIISTLNSLIINLIPSVMAAPLTDKILEYYYPSN